MQSYCTKFSDTSESFYKKFDGYGCNLEFKECVLFYNILQSKHAPSVNHKFQKLELQKAKVINVTRLENVIWRTHLSFLTKEEGYYAYP